MANGRHIDYFVFLVDLIDGAIDMRAISIE